MKGNESANIRSKKISKRKRWMVSFLAASVLVSGGALSSEGSITASAQEYSAAHAMPASVSAADAEYTTRRDTLLDFMVDQAQNTTASGSSPFGSFTDDGSTLSFRRIAAYLVNYKKQQLGQGNYSLDSTVPSTTPQDVANWCAGITKTVRAGTDLGNGNGDYDFTMKEMVSLLYLFKNDSSLLTNDAAYNIINNGLVYRGSDYSHFLTVEIDALGVTIASIPETENHLLMELSSIWLTNQYITENPRNDSRLRTGSYADTSSYANTAAFKQKLLEIISRTVYCDLFETNGRNYETFSLHALFNLYCFSDDTQIKNAAKNAIDYLAAKYAFQSYEGKRYASNRRNYGYKDRQSMYENDSVVFMMAMLSGAYVWNDTYNNWSTDGSTYFTGQYSQGRGEALWMALFMDQQLLGTRAYSLPVQIHDFMLDKKSGYWAVIQARYTSSSYTLNDNPNYFNSNGTIYSSGDFVSAPECYFVTNQYMNVMGGSGNKYPYLTGVSLGASFTDAYDFLSRNSALIPSGFVRDWGTDSNASTLMNEDVLNLTSDRSNWWNAENLGTYKNFTYGYSTTSGALLSVPASWSSDTTTIQPSSAITYKIVNKTSARNFYVVIGNLSSIRKNILSKRVYRGFYEVIPGSAFSSVSALQTYLLTNNPASRFSDNNNLTYRLYSGEVLSLDKYAGYYDTQTIKAITAADGTQLANNRFYIDVSNPSSMPLIDVRAVNSSYQYTGVKYAYSTGDGKIQIYNPTTFAGHGHYLCIDSSSITNATEYESETPFISTGT